MDKGYIGCEGVVFSTGTCWMLWSEWRSWRGGDLFHDVPDIPRSVSVKRSVVLDRWIQDPRVDRDLARRLLREVQSRVEVQIGMDYTMEMEEVLGEGRLG